MLCSLSLGAPIRLILHSNLHLYLNSYFIYLSTHLHIDSFIDSFFHLSIYQPMLSSTQLSTALPSLSHPAVPSLSLQVVKALKHEMDVVRRKAVCALHRYSTAHVHTPLKDHNDI